MKVGIFSDTHDRIQETGLALEIFARHKVGAVVHCGDWTTVATVRLVNSWLTKLKIPLFGVVGNMDREPGELIREAKKNSYNTISNEQVYKFQLDQKSAGVTHGENLALIQRSCSAIDYLFVGHTHTPIIEKTSHCLQINPGSICGPRPPQIPGSRSLVVLDTQTDKSEIIYLP